MNFKIIVSFFSLIYFYSNFVVGQQISFNYSLRYESFAMNDLRELQESVTSQWPVVSQKIVDMPSRITHAGSFTYYSGIYSVGLMMGYGSTGSRYYYEDYSGYLSNDFITSRSEIYAQFSLYDSLKSSQIVFRMEPGLNFSTLTISSKTRIGNESSEEEVNFNSSSISFRPGIGWRKNIKRFFIESMILYEINIPSKLLFSSNSDYFLQGVDTNPIDTNWSGIKLNLSVGIMLF